MIKKKKKDPALLKTFNNSLNRIEIVNSLELIFPFFHFYLYQTDINTTWKVFKYGVLSGPYFPVFELDTEIYDLQKWDVVLKALKFSNGRDTR